MQRSISLFLLAFVSACGNSGGPNGNVGGNGSPDMSVTATAMCSVVKQDCTGGQKCVPMVQGSNMAVVGYTCVPNGSVAEGQPCKMINQTGLLYDNCVAGSVCDNTGGDSSLNCHKYCDTTTTCAGASAKCAAVFTSAWGLCVPSCTPFGTDCPSGNDCSTTFDAVSKTANSGVFVCKATGMGKAFGSCSSDTDCGANLACVGPQCVPVCDNAHQCPNVPTGDGGTFSCQSYVNLPNGAGVCG